VRAVALHPDVLVATSAIWQTNCTIVSAPVGERDRTGSFEGAASDESSAAGGPGGGDTGEAPEEAAPGREAFMIDSPVLPDELDALPSLLRQSGFPAPSGLLATHGDWDHLLGRLAFPGVALGCAESTTARLAAAPGAAQRELRAFDASFYIPRPYPLMLGSIQALPVPGRCGIGELELELYPADGHTGDGMAVWISWARVLVVGDYLSTVEPPEFDQGDPVAYCATLERLRPLVEAADHVVPGHGPVLDSTRALGVLDENLAAL
jgi:glyoxylase-like metal-dependent hydrolase (beta-lactamase superfamily II)